jgi:hypothetical protein
MNQLWYKYIYMEEMLGNVAGAIQVLKLLRFPSRMQETFELRLFWRSVTMAWWTTTARAVLSISEKVYALKVTVGVKLTVLNGDNFGKLAFKWSCELHVTYFPSFLTDQVDGRF